jgi:hypothetical protein
VVNPRWLPSKASQWCLPAKSAVFSPNKSSSYLMQQQQQQQQQGGGKRSV